LHPARGWRQRPCPACKAKPGELCRTPTGRRAGRPHTARLRLARRELLVGEQVWQEIERWGADVALVRFSGGGGNPGSIGAVTLEAAGERELARWESGEGVRPEARYCSKGCRQAASRARLALGREPGRAASARRSAPGDSAHLQQATGVRRRVARHVAHRSGE
jgi:hypothetical protein